MQVKFWSLEATAQDLQAPVAMSLPLPYKLPPARYIHGDQPWVCDIEFSGKDICGCDWPGGGKRYGLIDGPEEEEPL